MRFKDRTHAAEELADALDEYQGKPVVVYALPRGGVELGRTVAEKLHAPLDLLIPRKVAHPEMPEYAIASVTELGEVVSNKSEVASVDPAWFKEAVIEQRQEARRRRERYLAEQAPADVKDKIGIIVDDGIATGLTMKSAIEDLRTREPSSIVIAVPVAPSDTIKELETLVDNVIVTERPTLFLGAIGAYYDSFDQVSDEEVVEMMKTVS